MKAMAKRKQGKGESAVRLERLFAAMDESGLDAAVLDNRDDAFYFSGYTGSDSVAVLSAKKRRGWLVTDNRYTEEAEKTAPGLETTVWRGGFGAFVGGLLKKQGAKKVAYTPGSLSVAFFNAMRDAAGAVKEWRDVQPVISSFRSVKSPAEIDLMARALACSEAAFQASKKHWKIGMTEIEVKNDLEWEMRRFGADGTSFETIVAVGANASLPHAHAGGGKIQAGKMLLIDFGVKLDRYCSDLTRTMWFGDIPKVWRKRYQAVLDAQAAGAAAIAPGVACKRPDASARRVLALAGLEERFTHGLGHGVGLAIHEDPRLSQKCAMTLEPGNVVTVEPGVYFPGSGGIRIEDMALVTGDGMRILSVLPRDIESAVI